MGFLFLFSTVQWFQNEQKTVWEDLKDKFGSPPKHRGQSDMCLPFFKEMAGVDMQPLQYFHHSVSQSHFLLTPPYREKLHTVAFLILDPITRKVTLIKKTGHKPDGFIFV